MMRKDGTLMKMKHVSLFLVASFILAFLRLPAVQASAAPAEETLDVLRLLRNGGYTIYFRHGEATVGEHTIYIIIPIM